MKRPPLTHYYIDYVRFGSAAFMEWVYFVACMAPVDIDLSKED